MNRVVSTVIAAAFAAASVAAIAADNKPAVEKKPEAAAQKPATAEHGKQTMSPAKADPKADAKSGAQPAAAK